MKLRVLNYLCIRKRDRIASPVWLSDAVRPGQSIPLGMRSKVFLVLFVHNRRCQREQCKRSLQIAERRGGTE